MFKLKSKFLITVMLIFGITVFIGCQKEQIELSPQENTTEQNSMLGKKLENPYSVANMKKAYANLSDNLKSGIIIETTHYYVKFKPKNEDDLNVLKQDTTLELYDYPLDYEVIEGQEVYHDPEIPDNLPTYQYCAVPVDYNFPNVDYEILEKLYIPEEIETLKSSSLFIEALVDEALRITNNLDESENTTLKRRRKKWRPAGTIKLWDDYYNTYKPLEGVVVRARRWFTTHTGTTKSSGKYSCNGEFRRDANYSIIWERYHFSIRSGSIGQAKYDGPKQRGDWNLNIDGGSQELYGIVFKAAHYYYYKNILNLRRPPLNSTWKPQMKIGVYNYPNPDDEDVLGNHSEERRIFGIGTWIKVWNDNLATQLNYATVIHELAHASHWNMVRGDFDDADKIVKESWAAGVEWRLTRLAYPGYSRSYFGVYTGVVQDMIDGQSGYDQVSGYTIQQIEDALNGAETFNQWKNNIKNLYNNATENNLDNLFNHWD